MSDRLLVATRKGLFVVDRRGGAWHVTSTHFLGDPVTMVLADRRDGTLHATLNLGHFGVKMRRSHDAALSWEESPVPAYPPPPDARPAAPNEPAWALTQICALEAGGADQPGVLWAGTIPGGLFRSPDGGETWDLVRSLWDRAERLEWFGGGYDDPAIHSICVDAHDSARVTVGVSCGGVWQTNDGGGSWACRASGMLASYMPEARRGDPNIQDPHRLVQCASDPQTMWVQHHDGIFRSRDAAASWQACTAKPSSFGFAVAVHPQRPDTAWFVPAARDACRIPPDARLVVTRTRDGGERFETLDEGLPREPAYDLVYRHGLDVDASGERLAMGSTTGGLWLSEDGGERWTCLSAHLPPIYCVRFAAD